MALSVDGEHVWQLGEVTSLYNPIHFAQFPKSVDLDLTPVAGYPPLLCGDREVASK
jgi:hypothetical protein